MYPAWFDDRLVYYVSTDAWPLETAERMGVNYAPRLKDALPPRPKPPGTKTVLERIYVFSNSEQPNVLPSSPDPIGPASTNKPYSPIWVLYEVTWLVPEADREQLTSESALFRAERDGQVRIEATDQLVNCPIVADEDGNTIRVAVEGPVY